MARPVTVLSYICIYISPLHHFRFVYVLFDCEVPDDRRLFKCWSNKGLIMFRII